jgi:hypothetical protein
MEAAIDFSNNSYYVVRQGVINELITYLQILKKLFENLFCSLYKQPPTYFKDKQIEQSFSHYAAPFTETLLLYLKDTIENIVGKKLEPTYSYMRIYYEGSELKKHTDRESCEYSITLCIKNNENPWDIFFETKEGESRNISLGEGDFIIYKGITLPHWREKYEGKEQIQIFLHYIDVDGPYKEWALDKRESLCILK